MAVCQVAAVRQVHAEDRVARIQYAGVGGLVGLRAGVRLHVGVFGTIELLGAFARQIFDHVHVFAAAVIPLAGVTFGVLVGEHAAGGFENRFGGEIFAGDQFQARVLAFGLLADLLENFRVHFGQGP